MSKPRDHAADAAVVTELAASGFAGAQYEALIVELYRYAWPVMLDLIRTGKISFLPTKIPHSAISPDEQQVLHDSAVEREELALAAIGQGELRFRRSLKAGRWDPTAGRSLKSYFVGACTLEFWPEFNNWRAKRQKHLRTIKNLQASYPTVAHDHLADDPELSHSRREAVNLLLAKAKRRSPELEAICIGLQNGLTASELADRMGCSSRAIEGRLYQLRKTAWGLVRSGHIDPALVPGSRASASRAAKVR